MQILTFWIGYDCALNDVELLDAAWNAVGDVARGGGWTLKGIIGWGWEAKNEVLVGVVEEYNAPPKVALNGGLAVAANAGAGEYAGGLFGEHGRAECGEAPWLGCGGTQIPPDATFSAELRLINSCNSVL